MNVGSPSDGEKDQVKLNQQSNDTPSGNPPQAWPPKDQTTPGNVPPQTPPPAPSPAPPPPASPPPPPKDAVDIGVGKPNIGVELEDQKAASQPPPDKPEGKPTISVSTSEVKIPPPSPPNVPPTTTPPEPPPSPPAETTAEARKIEVQTSDIPIKTYDQAKTTEQPTPTSVPPAPAEKPQPAPSTPAPPVKSSTSPTATITVLAILALILGAGAGFFGFRSWDKLKTSASVEKSPETTLTATATSQESPSTNLNQWPTYASTLYNFSLKYPQDWEVSTTEPTAETIVFASDKESLSGDPSGYRIEINFQDANGMTLKNWVEANSVATNETKAAKEITVDGQTAYQQELTKIRPAVASYIERPGKIMIVTYTAPPDLMSEGGDWYNNLINSIKLT